MQCQVWWLLNIEEIQQLSYANNDYRWCAIKGCGGLLKCNRGRYNFAFNPIDSFEVFKQHIWIERGINLKINVEFECQESNGVLQGYSVKICR